MKPPWLPSFVLGMLFYFFFLFISNPNSDSKSILIVLQKSFLFLSCEFENRIFFFSFLCFRVWCVSAFLFFSIQEKKSRFVIGCFNFAQSFYLLLRLWVSGFWHVFRISIKADGDSCVLYRLGSLGFHNVIFQSILDSVFFFPL